MTKIAVIVNKYYPFIGGTENLAKTIVENALLDDYEVEIITNPLQGREPDKINYKVNEILLNDITLLNNTLKQYDICFFFADLHSEHLNGYNFSCKRNICVLNIDERTYQMRNSFSNATNNLKKFDKVVTFTLNGVANKFLKENNIPNVYIQNFSRDVLKTPKNNEFADKIKNLFQNTDRSLIVYPAVFEQRKNQLYLISKMIEQSHLREFNWLFIGPFHESSYISECILQSRKMNLPTAFMKGTNDLEKLDNIYQVSDIVCLTSIAEGMPLVLFEAMSANKPWVSTPVGGVPSVLGNTQTGVILSAIQYTGNELYESIKTALKLEKNNNSRDIWENNYNEKIVLQKYKNLVKEIIQ